MNIVLIGYRGTGKTSVARRLGLRLGWTWVDADVEIELAAGKSIAEIFADDGESAFRDLEDQVLTRLFARDDHVLALGGGAVVRDENRRLITGAGRVVWLRASPQAIALRVAEDPASPSQRPNLTASGGLAEIINVLASREPLYRECSEFEVDTEDKDIEQVADEILGRLELDSADTSRRP